ncbi:MAG TPA: DUF5919 domain-containing protein [Longimicrobium sp.]|nr:DUF5919 domain-containing protein [Longimicrobium sp.]
MDPGILVTLGQAVGEMGLFQRAIDWFKNDASTSHEIQQRTRKAGSLDLLVTWCYEIPVMTEALVEILDHRGGSVRALLLNPRSRFVAARAAALGEKPADARATIKSNLLSLQAIQKRVRFPSHLQIRQYDALPTVALFSYDKMVLAAWLLQGTNFREGPSTLMRKSEKQAKAFLAHFEALWGGGVDYRP